MLRNFKRGKRRSSALWMAPPTKQKLSASRREFPDGTQRFSRPVTNDFHLFFGPVPSSAFGSACGTRCFLAREQKLKEKGKDGKEEL
jgi:hypothetical protein